MTPLDPFSYEILRHRLGAITVEGAIALQRVSGSPLATEAFDLNTALLSATGEVVFSGPYLLTGPIGQGLIVRWILEHRDLGPVESGDVFLCNDPYAGAAHQNCVTVVAPIHDLGELFAWAGATLHVVDVGGPTAGQVGIGARSILDEAPPTEPTRIVRRGRLDEAAEATYLARSRTPELNALDLRAKLAAVNAMAERVGDLVREHGRATIEAVLAETIDRGVAQLRARLTELPDATIARSAYIDVAGDEPIEPLSVDLRLDKRGDRLVLDFGASSPQAPAIVNCTRSGLLSGVVIGVLTTLVWDGPWCPAAVDRTIEVVSRPGTVVDARWPAGCSMATMAAGFASTTITALALGELLARSVTLQDRAMAAWAGAVGSVDVFGVDASGRRFGTVLLDTMASGAGATGHADGVDCGGFLRSMACVIADVEEIEARFPLLYLFRRQEPDSGGPGRRRGGVGIGFAVVAHGVERIDTVSPHFNGTVAPESLGLAGGSPGATNAAWLVAGSTAHRAMAGGRLPGAPEALGGEARPLPGVAAFVLQADDVLVVRATGGGGFGDPIERDPAAVARDVQAGLVGPASAQADYGVAIADGSPDPDGTARLRDAVRADRRRSAGLAPLVDEIDVPSERGPLADGWLAASTDRGLIVTCGRCGHAERLPDPVEPLAAWPTLVRAVEPTSTPGFELVWRICPACARSLEVGRRPALQKEG
jgi:N-methylhydantoinase B